RAAFFPFPYPTLFRSFRFGGLQVEGGVGDVDGAVVGLYATLVRLAVGQLLGFEHRAPAVRRLGEGLGVVHQQVRAPLVRGAVGLDRKSTRLNSSHVKI